MQKLRVPINSFQFGEVSDSLLMRSDTPVYASSAQSLQNMIVMSEGSVKKRDGLKHIYTYSGLSFDPLYPDQSHLIRFMFSDDEQYIISVEHEKIRAFFLYPDGSVALVSTVTLDTNSNALPFDQEWLKEYTFAQYGDVMFICHPLFMPRMLIRTGLTSFEVTPFSFDNRYDNSYIFQPYTSFQAKGVTLDPSATSGNITLTSSSPHWTPDHVGSTVRYHDTEIDLTGYTSPTVVSGTVNGTLRIRLSILNPLRTSDGSSRIEVTQLSHGYAGGEAVTIEDASAVGGINTASVNGNRTVAGIIDENTWYYTAGATANAAEDGGGYVKVVTHATTAEWSEQSFSAVRGYPAAVVFHENRLSFAGTIAEPDAIWMSGIGSFFNFDVGDANDNEAISLIAATGSVNSIRYMVSNRDLQIFGAAGELYVPTYLNQAITPTNAQIRLQTPYGCEFTQPVSMDGGTLFVQNGGRTVREYLYTDGEDAYTASAVSTIASHLIFDPQYMAVVHGGFGTPESYAMISNGNGDIALFNSNRTERRAGWTRLTTVGDIASVCAMHGRSFANVWNEDGTMCLCEFTGQIGLDRYITQTANGSGVVSVNSVFTDGTLVSVVSEDGLSYIGQYTVAAGAITISGGAGQTYNIGLPFTAEIITNPIDASTGGGPATGSVRGIASAVLDLRNASSVRVNGYKKSANGPASGKHEYRILGYSRDPQVTITQSEPLPMQINGIIAELIL